MWWTLNKWATSNYWGCPSIEHTRRFPNTITWLHRHRNPVGSLIHSHLMAHTGVGCLIIDRLWLTWIYLEVEVTQVLFIIHIQYNLARVLRLMWIEQDKRRVRIYRKSLAEYRKLADSPDNIEHAYSNIPNFSCHSVTFTSKVFPAKKFRTGPRFTYEDSWSPIAIALTYQRIAILHILGHIQGTKGRTIWRTL